MKLHLERLAALPSKKIAPPYLGLLLDVKLQLDKTYLTFTPKNSAAALFWDLFLLKTQFFIVIFGGVDLLALKKSTHPPSCLAELEVNLQLVSEPVPPAQLIAPPSSRETLFEVKVHLFISAPVHLD